MRDQWLGCVLAGAVGDALGGPVEFMGLADIRAGFPGGVREYGIAYGGPGRITDDTQMTLFTLEAMIRARMARGLGLAEHPVSVLQHAYQRWYHTQGTPWHRAGGLYALEPEPDGWLVREPDLHHRRAPGATVLTALRGFAGGLPSAAPEQRVNDSKGCGAVMRAAPVALWSGDAAEVFDLAARSGALTHGHPSGYLSAGALAFLVRRLLDGATLPTAIEESVAELSEWDGNEETVAALAAAVSLAEKGRPTPEDLETLGGGWVGEEALAISVCAALHARDVLDGLAMAVEHSGDSDSTGSICGNLLGAVHGVDAIPRHLLDALELREAMTRLVGDAVLIFTAEETDPDWQDSYPAW
ncbi:ADP-ribosylglycohydrolase family protein [Actinokineospora guangxiensis]|uniref:ADP-ribosylglycohydrolase family protein n=1 Tax=Actinokineospora guangxiensis TaxID=1490288 RepID=A0ABW0EJF3_9PSEU